MGQGTGSKGGLNGSDCRSGVGGILRAPPYKSGTSNGNTLTLARQDRGKTAAC